MKRYRSGLRFLLITAVALLSLESVVAQSRPAAFKVLVLAEGGGVHKPFVEAAKVWLQKEGQADNFTVDTIEDTKAINAESLKQYRLFIQLNYPPYNWTLDAAIAFTQAIEQGTIGWIGFHHATLLGEFDGFPIWPWFSQFMGDIRFTNYIPTFVSGTVRVEDSEHPAMKGVPHAFTVENEEWYTWDHSPRAKVHVLASVDENTYKPDTLIKMGDHPVVWTNEQVKARNIYIFMGHHAELFQNPGFTTLFHNSILWASGR